MNASRKSDGSVGPAKSANKGAPEAPAVGGQESDLNIFHKFSPDFLDFSGVSEVTEELICRRAEETGELTREVPFGEVFPEYPCQFQLIPFSRQSVIRACNDSQVLPGTEILIPPTPRIRHIFPHPRGALRSFLALFTTAAALMPTSAHASFLQGEALDNVADFMSWIVIILVPIVGIVAFRLVHILPEKIAMKKKHPQAKAIQCLCLLSLVSGGLPWPIAWLWAYTKPVLHKLAYGTDRDEFHGHPSKAEIELTALRSRITELESKLTTEENNGQWTPSLSASENPEGIEEAKRILRERLGKSR